MKTKTIKQTVVIDASPHDIFETLLDSSKHAALADSSAVIDRSVGGSFNIYDGYITGTNLELEQDTKIVQLWRAEEDCWPKEHFSRLRIILEKTDGGTKLEFTQEDVPEECYDDIYKGWYDFYWNPLKEMLK